MWPYIRSNSLITIHNVKFVCSLNLIIYPNVALTTIGLVRSACVFTTNSKWIKFNWKNKTNWPARFGHSFNNNLFSNKCSWTVAMKMIKNSKWSNGWNWNNWHILPLTLWIFCIPYRLSAILNVRSIQWYLFTQIVVTHLILTWLLFMTGTDMKEWIEQIFHHCIWVLRLLSSRR